MNRSKFSFFITASLVAVLLTFASVAQAGKGGNKGPNPGGDNPGTTTEYYGSEVFEVIANAGARCRDVERICEDYARTAFPFFIDGGDLNSFSYAYADWDLSCRAAARSSGAGHVYMVGGGLLELNRHGKHGAMHHIEFAAGMAGMTALWVDSRVRAGTMAEGEVFAIGGVYGTLDACASCAADGCFDANGNPVDIGSPGGVDRVLETCGMLEGYNFGIGGGWAEAQAAGRAFAGAGAQSAFALGSWTGVWAANIELFKSVVAGGAGNFVTAASGAQVDVWVETFVGDFMATYFEACADADITPPGAYVEICADGGSIALGLAYARAEAFAAARARALASMYGTVIVPAIYYNADGNTDVIGVGDFGGAAANVEVACGANADT